MKTYGPFYPSIIAVTPNPEAGNGGVAWSDPSNAAGDNDSEAQAALDSEVMLSKILLATGFNCNLPAKAVLGIKVEVEAFTNADNVFHVLRLAIAGNPTGQNKGDWDPYVSGGGQATIQAFGGAQVTWAVAPNQAKLNASNFGVALAFASTTNGTVKVRRIKVTVYCED